MIRNTVLLIFIALVASGCSEFNHRIDISAPTALGTGLTYDYKDKASTNYFKTLYASATDKKAERNRIIFELMGLVDDEYSDFERNLRKDRAYKDIIVKIFSLGLTGAASLASESAAHTLAAVDTGLKGANEAIDSNAFRNNAAELLINKMRANRAAAASDIYEQMKKDADQYPLEAAIRDIIKYYNEGSVTSALASLAASTAQEAISKTSEANTKQQAIR